MKVTKFDKIICQQVAEQFLEALEPLATELGLHIKSKGGSYDEGSYTLKIEAAVVREDGIVRSREREDFTKYAATFDLDPAMLDQRIESNGVNFWVIGLLLNCQKYPVLVRRDDGKRLKMTADGVRSAWKRLHPETIKPATA